MTFLLQKSQGHFQFLSYLASLLYVTLRMTPAPVNHCLSLAPVTPNSKGFLLLSVVIAPQVPLGLSLPFASLPEFCP